MDNKFENHVKSDKVKWIVVFLALILLAVGLLSVSTDGFKALRRDKSPVDSTEIPVEDEGGGSVLTEGKSNGMKLAGAKLTSEEYEANGVSRAGGFGLYDYSYGNARERHGPDGFMDSGMDEWGKRLGERKGCDGVSELNAVCKYAHRDACV